MKPIRKPIRLNLGPFFVVAIGAALLVTTVASGQRTSPTRTPVQGAPRVRNVEPERRTEGRQQERSSSRRERVSTRDRGDRRSSGGGVRSSTGSGGGVRIQGEGVFRPLVTYPVVYGELPPLVEDVTLTLTGPMSAGEFIDTLALATNWNIIVSDEVQGITLRFWMNEMAPDQASEILKHHGVYYRYNEETDFLYFQTQEEYLEREHGTITQRTFTVNHAPLEDMEALIESFKSETGRIISDPRTLRIIVYDRKDHLDAMEKALKDFDVPLESRTYELKYVDVDLVEESVMDVLSPGGEMRIDPRTNHIIVNDHAARHERIAVILKSLDTELETRSWFINYADPEEIAEQASMLVPSDMGEIVVNMDIHLLTVKATAERLSEVDKLVLRTDIKRRQVQIEAYLLTATTNVARTLGINWSYFGDIGDDPFSLIFGGGGSTSLNNQPGGGTRYTIGALPRIIPRRDPVTGRILTDFEGNELIDGFRGNKLSVVVDYLEKTGDVKVLAHPRVTVQDGEEAIFENTTQVPFSQSTTNFGSTGSNNNFNSVSTISFINVGTILRVSPRIANDGNILLDISSEDSSFTTKQFTANGQTNEVPQKTQNKAETQVMVHDGDTIVLGGLRTSNYSDDVDRIPVLGDIPLIGRIFRTTTKSHTDTELLIFITPTIVTELSHPETLRLATYNENLAKNTRFDRKGALGKAVERIRGGKNEIMVSIGQSGDLFVDGEHVKMRALRKRFLEMEEPLTARVVIRNHARAPRHIAAKVVESAEEADLKVVFDDRIPPFVSPQPDLEE